MAGPKEGEQVGVWTNRRVEFNPDNFGVIGGSGADQSVIRVMDVTLRVADFCFHDSLDALEG